MKNTNEILAIVAELEKNCSFNDLLINYVTADDLKDCEDVDDIVEAYEKANENYELTTKEEVYYYNATKYLLENDPSFAESMDIAEEYWYDAKCLNSCILASLLQTRETEKERQTFLSDLREKLEDVNE